MDQSVETWAIVQLDLQIFTRATSYTPRNTLWSMIDISQKYAIENSIKSFLSHCLRTSEWFWCHNLGFYYKTNLTIHQYVSNYVIVTDFCLWNNVSHRTAILYVRPTHILQQWYLSTRPLFKNNLISSCHYTRVSDTCLCDMKCFKRTHASN
jgi:hypothetical protein